MKSLILLLKMKLRYANNARDADDMETKIFSNIHNYDFKAMNIRIKARLDFLDIYFRVEKSYAHGMTLKSIWPRKLRSVISSKKVVVVILFVAMIWTQCT